MGKSQSDVPNGNKMISVSSIPRSGVMGHSLKTSITSPA